MSTVGPSEFSADSARTALREVLATLTSPTDTTERLSELVEAREAAGNDLLKHMQLVFPVVARIQMDVIANYGFPADGEGVIAFTHAVRAHERDHPDVALLAAEVQAHFVPPMMPPSPGADYDG